MAEITPFPTPKRDKRAAEDVPADRKVGPARGKHPLPGGRYERDGSPGRLSKTMRKGVVPRVSQAEKHRRSIARRYGLTEAQDD